MVVMKINLPGWLGSIPLYSMVAIEMLINQPVLYNEMGGASSMAWNDQRSSRGHCVLPQDPDWTSPWCSFQGKPLSSGKKHPLVWWLWGIILPIVMGKQSMIGGFLWVSWENARTCQLDHWFKQIQPGGFLTPGEAIGETPREDEQSIRWWWWWWCWGPFKETSILYMDWNDLTDFLCYAWIPQGKVRL